MPTVLLTPSLSSNDTGTWETDVSHQTITSATLFSNLGLQTHRRSSAKKASTVAPLKTPERIIAGVELPDPVQLDVVGEQLLAALELADPDRLDVVGEGTQLKQEKRSIFYSSPVDRPACAGCGGVGWGIGRLGRGSGEMMMWDGACVEGG